MAFCSTCRQQLPEGGSSSQLDAECSPGATCALFIMHTWSFDVFFTSLQTYVAAGLGPHTVVIDNSESREALYNPQVCTAC